MTVKRRRWVSLLALTALFACLAPVQADEQVTVVFVDRVVNRGDAVVPDVNVALVCAPDTPAQSIGSLELQPVPTRIETDRWGQRIARFHVDELRPGEHFVARSITDATLRPWQIDLASVEVGSTKGIPDDVRELYLADSEKYVLESEPIRSAVEGILKGQAGRPEPDPVEVIGAAFDYVVDHLKYSRDGTWDSADTVLERGTGSCSEYTFAFIALCRACGIPARFAGGNARRSGASLHIDRVSHRWAEAYLPGLGWVPFDPTRSDGKDRYRRYFGRCPGDVLVLARGDGGPESAIGWRYESFHTWEAPQAAIGVHRRGWWFSRVPEEVRAQALVLGDAIARAQDTELKLGLIRKARSIAHPFVLPWLEDLLYNADVRVETAEATRDIGGPAAVIALIDCLERAGDPEGDAAIGFLLDRWTGERIGASRKGWQDWLRTRAFRAFTTPSQPEPER